MKLANDLIAYLQKEEYEPFIDIIKISKNGTSFFYDGTWWQRELVMRTGYCTSDKDEKLKINPLSRSYDPYLQYDGEIEIKSSARERYEKWVRRELKP